jgi:hypothetical protein
MPNRTEVTRRKQCSRTPPTSATAPYSYSGSEILRRRFPQQSPGRAAVKISVQGLRMKFSGGCLQWQLAGPTATSSCAKHEMF